MVRLRHTDTPSLLCYDILCGRDKGVLGILPNFKLMTARTAGKPFSFIGIYAIV